jgi:hypothetical protein
MLVRGPPAQSCRRRHRRTLASDNPAGATYPIVLDLMPAQNKAAPVVIALWEAPATHGANAAKRP